MTHLTDDERAELLRLCEAAKASFGDPEFMTAALIAFDEAATPEAIITLLEQLEELRADLKEAQFAQASTARRVAEGIAREAKLREALIVLNSAIDAFWNDEGRKPIVTSTGTRTDNPVTAIVSAQQAALAALKEGASDGE
jgi:hypothetical protein